MSKQWSSLEIPKQSVSATRATDTQMNFSTFDWICGEHGGDDTRNRKLDLEITNKYFLFLETDCRWCHEHVWQNVMHAHYIYFPGNENYILLTFEQIGFENFGYSLVDADDDTKMLTNASEQGLTSVEMIIWWLIIIDLQKIEDKPHVFEKIDWIRFLNSWWYRSEFTGNKFQKQ